MAKGSKSTIHPAECWLRERSSALPWRNRWSFLCLPPRCYFCAARGDVGHLDLCQKCLHTLPWFEDRAAPPTVRTVFSYDDPVARALKDLKYAGDRRAARLFGALLATVGASDPPDLLIPIPLHTQKLCDRGFNQSWLIARHVGAWLGRPVRNDWMMRTRATPSQTGLHAGERRRNVHGAFFVAPGVEEELARLQIRRVALIDDIATTGATLESAQEALQERCAVEVQSWSVARAMPTNTTRPT